MTYRADRAGALSVVGGLARRCRSFIATFKPFEHFLAPVFSSDVDARR